MGEAGSGARRGLSGVLKWDERKPYLTNVKVVLPGKELSVGKEKHERKRDEREKRVARQRRLCAFYGA